MASRATRALALLLVTGFTLSQALTLDEDATNDAIAASSASEEREVAILLRGPHEKAARREELLHGKVTDESAFSLFYNSKSNKVSLESLHGGHLKSISWGLGSHPRETLLLVVTHEKVKLYVGCQPLHWHPMSGRHDILTLLANKKFKLYHEENAPVDVYDSEKAALKSLNCDHHELSPPTLVTVDSDVEEVKDFIAREERLKREEMQGDDYRNNYIDPNILPTLPPPTPPATQRGDIPNTDIESCDDEVIRQLKLLRQTIEHLRRELGDQKGLIDGLRNQMRACCNRANTAVPVERCSGSSCYPGYINY